MNLSTAIALISLFVMILGFAIGQYRYAEAARARIYTRFDEYKKLIEEKMERNYVRKDVHDLRVQQIENDIREIKVTTAFIPSISANLNLLLAKQGIEGTTR